MTHQQAYEDTMDRRADLDARRMTQMFRRADARVLRDLFEAAITAHEADGRRVPMLKFKMVRENDSYIEPTRKHEDDAGFDLYVSQAVTVPAGGSAVVHHNVAVEAPRGWFTIIAARSSTFRRGLRFESSGIIDNGYRGELLAEVTNVTDKDILIDELERVVQLIPMYMWMGSYETVDELSPSDRGVNGFGSSGK